MISEDTEWLDIPIEQLEIGKSQSRIRQTDKNMDQLIKSIRTRGLLQPPVVFKNENDKYEIIIGQRRFLAVKEIGYSKVRCKVVKNYQDSLQAKMDSITENEIREDIPLKDKVELCTALFYRYGSIKAVADELGWDSHLVAKYVKLARLPEIFREDIKKGELDKDVALRVMDAITAADSISDFTNEQAYELALEIQRMNPQQRLSTYDIIKSNPYLSIEQIIEKGKEIKPYKDIKIQVFIEDYQRIKTYAEDDDSSIESAIIDLIKKGLEVKGY